MMQEYDDPYSFLAWHLIAYSTPNDLERVLSEDDYVKRLIIKEIRNYDLQGPFTDAVVETILTDKRRMDLMHQLDDLAQYFFTELDLPRLRNKIIEYCHLYNIM